jgi:hypothetical protein
MATLLMNAILEDNGDWAVDPTVANLEATDANVASGGSKDNPLVRVGFETPDPLNDGTDLQLIEVYAAMTRAKTGVPTIHLELYENGSTLGVTAGPFNLTSLTHSAFQLTFDSSILSGDGTDVELRVTGLYGGSGGNTNGVAIDSIIWYADSTPAETSNSLFFGTLDILDMKVGTTPVLSVYFGTQLVWSSTAPPSYYYIPDGTDDVIYGAVNLLDLENTPHVIIEWNGIDMLTGEGSVCSQNISTLPSTKAFQIDTEASNSQLEMTYQGAFNLFPGVLTDGDHIYKIEYTHGGNVVLSIDGSVEATQALVVNGAFEPTAKFKILARSGGTVDSEGYLADFAVYNFRLNDGTDDLINCKIDDGWANDPVIINTGTGGTLTATNFQSGGWTLF